MTREPGIAQSSWRRPACGLAVVMLLAAALPFLASSLEHSGGAVKPGSLSFGEPTSRVRADIAGLPLAFEANVGQARSDVRFQARGNGFVASFTPSEAIVSSGSARGPRDRVALRLVGARPGSEPEAVDPEAGKANYLVGEDRTAWHTDVAMFGRVAYRDAYPGIDVLFHGTNAALEYDFVVAPGADTDIIAMQFRGAEGLRLDSGGDLLLSTATGVLRHHRPVAFQDTPTGRTEVDARYVIGADETVRLHLGAYDHARALTVDPVIDASTYYGGGSSDYTGKMALDRLGNVYLAGTVYSDDFPTTANGVNPSRGGQVYAAAVVKLNADLSAVQYATFLLDGDDGSSTGTRSLAVDGDGNAYVGGTYHGGQDRKATFPTTANRVSACGHDNVYLAKLSAGGNQLSYSTCFDPGPGAGNDAIAALAVAAPGRVWVSAGTQSGTFPTTAGGDRTFGGDFDAVLALVDTTATGPSLVYSTFVGGAGIEGIPALAVDAAGNVYADGTTTSQASFLSGCPNRSSTNAEGFLIKLNASGVLQHAYCGPLASGGALAVDTKGNVYLFGEPASDIRALITPNAYRKDPGQLYLAKMDPTGAVVYATYLPASQGQAVFGVYALTADDSGHVYIGAATSDPSFVTKNAPIRSVLAGQQDGVVAEIDTGLSGEASLVFATLLGGSEIDGVADLALGPDGDLYVYGGTQSRDLFPPPGATGLQKKPNDTGLRPIDWFVAKVSPPPVLTSVSATGGLACGGTKLQVAGARLRGTSKVTFGDRGASAVQQVDDNHIELVVPARSPGPVDVTVTARSGTVSFPYTYRPVPTPAVSALTPDRGPVEGGTAVTITGTDLDCVRGVRFGDADEVPAEANPGGGLRAVAPVHARGPVDVVLSADKGDGSRLSSVAAASSRFTYLAIPSVSALVPSCGPAAGGTQVVVQGQHLAGATGVAFGTATAPAIGDTDPSRLVTTSPGLSSGDVDVRVTTADGTSAPGAAAFRAPCPAAPAPGPVLGNSPAGPADSPGGQSTATPTGGTGAPGPNPNPGQLSSGNAGSTGGVGGGGGSPPAAASTPGAGGSGGGGTPAGVSTPAGGGSGGGGSPAAASTPGGGGGGGGGAPALTPPPGAGGSPGAGAASTPGSGGGGGGTTGAASTPGGGSGGGGTTGAASTPGGGDAKEAPRYAMVVDGHHPGPAVVCGLVLLVLLGCVMGSAARHVRATTARRAPAWARATG